jgi:hypothetical protein
VLEACPDPAFPYRLTVTEAGRQTPTLVVRTKDAWPGSAKYTFCLRETEPPAADEVRHEVERVPVVAVERYGKQLTVVLDRKRAARSSFLITTKPYKTPQLDGRSHYEVILWRTQASLRQHRPHGVRLVSRHAREVAELAVRIDSSERYPWHFGRAHIERGPLAVGDYALLEGERVLAVVERKTFDNLLGDFGHKEVLHQQLTHLSAQGLHALVIEADYADFLAPQKVQPWPATYCAEVLAELMVAHPKLRIVFCGNRKMAEEWTRNFFRAVWKAAPDAADAERVQPIDKPKRRRTQSSATGRGA